MTYGNGKLTRVNVFNESFCSVLQFRTSSLKAVSHISLLLTDGRLWPMPSFMRSWSPERWVIWLEMESSSCIIGTKCTYIVYSDMILCLCKAACSVGERPPVVKKRAHGQALSCDLCDGVAFRECSMRWSDLWLGFGDLSCRLPH